VTILVPSSAPITENEIIKKNPFASIDQTGVGQLIQIAVEKGSKTRPGIKLGICGEHGGDPDSVKFCHRAGLTYVSCSPYPRAGCPVGGGAGGD
jgi:pyruvate,orthophosphate dikinase